MSRSTSIGRPKKAVLTERFNQDNRTRTRKYTRLKTLHNGQVKYHKIQLRTLDDKIALQRASIIADLDDPALAKSYIAYLADAKDAADEKRRLAKLLQHPMLTKEPDEAVLDRLIGVGIDPEYIESHPEVVENGRHTRINKEWVKKNPRRKHEANAALGALMGLPAEHFKEQGASKFRLQDCVEHWAESRRALKRNPKTIRDTQNAFEIFMNRVGNKSISNLSKDDLTKYESHIISIKGDRGNSWQNNQLNPIGRVLRHVLRKTDWDFPTELHRWIDSIDRAPTASPRTNRQPMPVETFKQLLDKAEQNAALDVNEFAESMPLATGAASRFAKINNIKQANRIKRRGTAWSCMLRLFVQCGFDPVDITRLTWAHLHLTGKVPYMDLPRVKAEHTVGDAIPRMTPLHKSTVKALKAWKVYATEWLGHAPKQDELVFRNDAKKPLTSGIVSKNFGLLAKDAGIDRTHTCKHMRNVGGSLAKKHKLPDAHGLRLAFLGHDENGTNQLYTGDVDQHYLVELVNVIGREYFDSDRI